LGHVLSTFGAMAADFAGESKDFEYDSGHVFKSRLDESARRWTVEVRIPLPLKVAGRTGPTPQAGDKWRVNLFRYDAAHDAYLAWSPTLKTPAAFHVPDKFGTLEFRK
jgi:hypothetical protein